MMPPRKQLYFEVLDYFFLEFYKKKRFPKSEETRDYLKELGHSRGSPNEFIKYRDLWKEERGYTDLNNVIPHQVLPDPIEQATQTLRDTVMAEAEEKITAHTEDYESQLLAVRTQLEELTQKHQALDEAYKNQAHDIVLLKDECELTKTLHTQAMVELDKTKGELQAVKEESEKWYALSQQTQHNLQNDHKEQIAQITTSFDTTLTHCKQELSSTREFMETQRHEFTVQNTNLKAENSKLQENVSKLQQEKEILKVENKELLNKNQKLEISITEKTQENVILNEKMDKLIFNETKYVKLFSPVDEKLTNISEQQTLIQTNMSTLSAELHTLHNEFSQAREPNGK
jgi:chromosome segregation ATPase